LNNQPIKLSLSLVFFLFFFIGTSQFKQDTSKKVQLVPLPLIFRSPETKWAVGLSSSLSFKTSFRKDTLTRTSNIQLIGLVTQLKQNVEAIDAVIYFPKEKYILYFQSSHSLFPDKYWGLGPNTSDHYENYRFEQFYYDIHLKRRVLKNTFIGFLNEFQNLFDMNYIHEGKFDSTITLGKNGSIVSGLGISISYDSRNSGFWPTKGVYNQTLVTYFNKYFGSQFNYLKTAIDLRFFKNVFMRHVFAGQFYNYTSSSGTPIRELAMLGGSDNLRGFYQGRYRDHSLISAIVEYRVPIYKRFGLCVFYGAGNVYNEFKDLQNVTFQIKQSYGGGIRFAILKSEKLNLRLDYGYHNKFNRGVYFTVGEAF
jgi:outer membrane protein assembly factor BamA